MKTLPFVRVVALSLIAVLLGSGGNVFAAAAKVHHVAIQVSTSDPAVMNLALNNVVNLTTYYEGIGDSVQIELVAYGPGLNMFRDDKSPVKDRLKSIKESLPNVTFSACSVTKKAMEKSEGKTITIVPQAGLVPSGAVRLVQLQEEGWSYLRP